MQPDQRSANAPLAVTMGEPGGIGAEITISAWKKLRETGPVFFALDDPARLSALGASPIVIETPSEAVAAFKDGLPVIPLKTKVEARLGDAEPKNAAAVIEAIEAAVDLTLAGAAAAVVTNPIQKSSLAASGFAFPGHTEFLAALAEQKTGADHVTPVMMLAGPSVKTVPVTIHMALAKAIESLSSDQIIKTAEITAASLKSHFGLSAPRLAISGLNPHAGEQGVLGHEDDAIIAPAVKTLRERGIDARGPLPADGMFHPPARASYDAALCMYHDQALIPVKALDFDDAVNVTLGLPFIRTSPDHGTALDIAGKGLARADSLIAAIKMAQQMAARAQPAQ